MATASRAPPALTIDPREGTVSGAGGEVRLEPKVMEVLVVLARYSGHVVQRAELLDAVWPDTVVTEHTLSRCVYQLRESLRKVAGPGENGDAIETLPKRGYRLLAHVDRAPRELRVSGDRLLIELRRPTALLVGLVLFVLAIIGFAMLLP